MLGEGSPTLEEIERESYKSIDVWSITLDLPNNVKSLSVLANPLHTSVF
jgi:hypothetical protein